MSPRVFGTRVIRRGRGLHDVFIGRPSIFGNPFHLGADGTRTEVLIKYEVWLRQRLVEDLAFARELDGLRGKVLACFCAPKPCHGNIIVKLIKERFGCDA
jgi:hypothetical protein